MTPTPTTRRRVLRGAGLLVGAGALGVASTGSAAALPGKPNFSPAIYADGETWGTKGAAPLPAPTDRTRQAYDALYVVTNGADGQLPVGEAAPGNPAFNGGRWFTHTATWTAEGFADHGTVPLLTSQEDVDLHESLGHLDVSPGSPPGGPPAYFECPLLPVKD